MKTIHPLKFLSRYRDPQLHVGENYTYLFNFRPKHLQVSLFKHTIIYQYQWLFDHLIKRTKNTYSGAWRVKR